MFLTLNFFKKDLNSDTYLFQGSKMIPKKQYKKKERS
jgi:hypothetical protein